MAKTVLIESKPAITKVGASGTPLEYYVQTQYQVDDSGKLIKGTSKSFIAYNNSTIPGVKNFIQAAETTDGGANWLLKNGLDGKPIFGADAQRSLKEGALKTDTQKAIVSSANSAAEPLSKEEQKQLADSTKNQATTTENGDQSSLSEADDKRISEDKGTEFDGTRSKFRTDLRFPLNFKSDHQDTIKFSMVKYRPRKLETSGDSLNPIQSREEAKDILGRVFLPIPAGISDTKSVDWASSNLDPFKAIGADIAQTSIVKGIGAGVKQIGNAATAVSNNSGDAGTAAANYFVQAATGAENLLSRTQGLIINPNMELLFTGPQLRQFGFTFKLSARSQDESQAILNIIRFFKQGMSPIRTKSQLFLKAPYTFQIQYLHRGKPHRYLNKIKECALQSFNVEYTPEGQYATFTSGAMVSYQITMQFSELEPIFNDEYGVGGSGAQNDSEIGY